MDTGDDEGFTLIEAVIAILVITVAVVTLVGALATLLSLSRDHRGHAVAETAARSFGQAVQAVAQSAAALAAPVAASSSTLVVTDATALPQPGAQSYLRLHREVVRITAVDRTTGVVSVVRGQGGTTPATHLAGAAVVPFLQCPAATAPGAPSLLTPDVGAWHAATGVTATVTGVEYWRPATSTFVDRTGCLSDFAALCPGAILLPECGAGLYRVTITVSTAGDPRLSGIGTQTRVLVRSGSAG